MSQLPSEPPPSTGLIDGKYQLVRLIGRGGMGSVWEARHASLGTPSAIKFIESEYADSQEARTRFIREAKAAATIQSKHAIQIYDHGVTDDGKPYIVMELLQGEPLDKRIERQGALTLQETARILQQVCRGLQRAHERGIVHRDLKPENIFLVKTPDDDDETAKVLDFGIAKISGAGSPSGVTSSTKTGAVLGTPFYMSPEQARGLKSVDHRTDVWSLGVIAYKCLTGKLPFDGESVGDLLVKICTAPVPLPSHAVAGLPPAFDTWFLRALEREPDRRFATVNELAEHLMYAAGIGARGASPSQQFSGVDTVASSAQAGHIGTPPPAMRSQMGAPSYTAPTPAPGGMTAAPFTSEPIAGVPAASRLKWIVGAAFLGLAVAGLGTGVAVAMKKRDTTSSNSVGITPSPPPPVSDKPEDPPVASAATPQTDPPAQPPLQPLEPPPTTPGTPTPVAAAAAPAKAVAPSKPGAHAKPVAPVAPTKPGPGTVTSPPPGPQPVPLPPVAAPPPPAPPPATPPPAKKPNKNDPGY